MPTPLRYALDFAALALVYFFGLLPRWKKRGKRSLAVHSVFMLYLSGVLFVTLMPILASLPFCFNHPYVPMHLVPFEDAILGRGDFVRQIVLNVVMMVPFGFLYPLSRRVDGKSGSLIRTLAAAVAVSLSIELLQPLFNAARSSDVTDLITNTAGALLGYAFFALCRAVWQRKKAQQ